MDFDLKRSHSLTSVVGKSNYSVDPSKSFKAWGEEKCSEELSKSKGQKISLDFKYANAFSLFTLFSELFL